jgi:hypothetical protein
VVHVLDAVDRLQEDRPEAGDGDDEQLEVEADPDHEDEQRNRRDRRNRAQELDHRPQGL